MSEGVAHLIFLTLLTAAMLGVYWAVGFEITVIVLLVLILHNIAHIGGGRL